MSFKNAPECQKGSEYSEGVSKTNTWRRVLETEKVTVSEVLEVICRSSGGHAVDLDHGRHTHTDQG